MADDDLLKRRFACVTGLLTQLTVAASTFAVELDLPPFKVDMMGSNTYGLRLINIAMRFYRAADSLEVARALASSSIRELAIFAVDEAAFPKYVEWLRKLRAMVDACELGDEDRRMTCSKLVAALAACESELLRTCVVDGDVAAARKRMAEFRKLQATERASRHGKVSVGPDSPSVGEVLWHLSGRVGLRNAVTWGSQIASEIIDADAGVRKPVRSPTVKSVFVDPIKTVTKQMKSDASMLLKNKKQLASSSSDLEAVIGPIAVVRNLEAAEPLLQNKDRFVITLDDMRLRKGSMHPTYDYDATELLTRSVAAMQIALKRLRDDVGGCKAFMLDAIDAAIGAFAAVPGEKKPVGGGGILAMLGLSGGGRVVSSAANAATLRRMGVAVGGDSYPTAPAPYPYPPQPPSPYGPYPPQPYPPYGQPPVQTVQIKEDPYMKTVAGLSVGAQCCSCCAVYALADAVSDL